MVCYKLLNYFPPLIRRVVIDVDSSKVIVLLGAERTKVLRVPLTIVVTWYDYSNLFHRSCPCLLRIKEMDLSGDAHVMSTGSSCLQRRYVANDRLGRRTRAAMHV